MVFFSLSCVHFEFFYFVLAMGRAVRKNETHNQYLRVRYTAQSDQEKALYGTLDTWDNLILVL